MARIVSLGSAVQDIYLIDRDDFISGHIKDIDIFGQIDVGSKVDIDQISFEIGGAGTNSAVEFARYGHQAIFLGSIGKDPAGSAIVSVLNKENVDTSYIEVLKTVQTGLSIILLDSRSGERTILTHRGASAKFQNLSADSLDSIRPDWLYISSLRGDFDTLTQFCQKAKSIGTKVMFNPGKLELADPSTLRRLLEYVEILLVNESEAAQIVPGVILTEKISQLANYVSVAIISAGSKGAIATNGTETYRVGLYGSVNVKDTTGAGDAFGSGFLAHFASGHSFRSSLIFAAANSASVISKLGAKKGLLTGSEDLHPMPIQKL